MNCILRTAARILIGALFIFSGYVKVIDPVGSAIKFGEYFEAFGMHALAPGALAFGVFLAVAELLLGLGLLFGLRMKQVSFLSLLIMVFMTGLTLVLAITDAVKDCGCFGDAVKLTNWQTFYKNLIILPIVVFIFVQRKKYKQIMSCMNEWVIAALLAVVCISLSVYNYTHLPFIDFMPYKCGVNIPQAMHVPADAPKDVYEESTFIYEKDGVKKTFTVENLPEDLDTWTFIDAPTPKLLQEGYTAPARDFSMSSEEATNIHEEILNKGGYLVFVTSPNINKIDTEQYKVMISIYDYCKNEGIDFMMISGSSFADDAIFAEKNNIEYPIFFTDETIVKSMVRSNPGIMLLKDGTILKKWNINDITTKKFADAVKQTPEKVISEYETRKNASTLVLGLLTLAAFIFFSIKAIRKK